MSEFPFGLKADAQGLVTVVAQDVRTGAIRMVAYADGEAVQATLDTRRATFFSRSRQSLWIKGESSGNTMEVHSVWADCDGDALIYLVDPAGPSCHTGADTCFFRRLDGEGEGSFALPVLSSLEKVLQRRQAGEGERSYTRSLLKQGAVKIGAKVREEADEFAQALEAESDERVISEAADVVYHLMVGLRLRDVPRAAVEAELARRFGMSGLDEKAARETKS